MKTYNEFIAEARHEMSGKEIYARTTKGIEEIEPILTAAFGRVTRVVNQRDIDVNGTRVSINYDPTKGTYYMMVGKDYHKGIKKDKLVDKIKSLTSK
jgi:hypothetical protein